MGKKNDTAKPASAMVESPASTREIAKPVAEAARPPTTNGDATPARAAVKKKPAKATPTKKPVIFSTEDIALRAYFISEHRQQHGTHGDEHSDWISAEKQLRAEHRKTAAKKPTRSKKA